MPPRMASLAVSIIVFIAGLWALALTDPTDSWVITFGGMALAAVFLFRGAIAYTSWWREKTPEQPFATFDVKVYGPLCLFIGVGFAWLSILRLI